VLGKYNENFKILLDVILYEGLIQIGRSTHDADNNL